MFSGTPEAADRLAAEGRAVRTVVVNAGRLRTGTPRGRSASPKRRNAAVRGNWNSIILATWPGCPPLPRAAAEFA